jgi:hypothetical protein
MALNLKLTDFKNRVGMGTRPNRYKVDLDIPGGGYKMEAEVSALNLPDSTVGVIGIPFRGRVLKLPGDRRYGSWGITVYDTTEDGNLWEKLHAWSERINEHFSNETPFDYDADTETWTVSHYDLNGDGPIKQVKLHNCWPSTVGPFDLSAGAIDTMSQFTVQVEYEYFEVI